MGVPLAFEARLRRLEDQFAMKDGSDPACIAAAAVEAKVEELGGLYNELEELLHKLECADAQKGAQITALEERIQRVEAGNVSSQLVTQTPVNPHEMSASKADAVVNERETLEAQLASQQVAIDALTTRLQQLEGNTVSAPVLSQYSTTELVEALIQRLQAGHTLDPTVQAELQTALGAHGTKTFLEDPSNIVVKTNASTMQSIASSRSGSEPPHKRMRGRPRKQSSGSEQSIKRPVGRPRKRQNDSEQTIKRPIGRPRKDSVNSKKGQDPLDDHSDISRQQARSDAGKRKKKAAETVVPNPLIPNKGDPEREGAQPKAGVKSRKRKKAGSTPVPDLDYEDKSASEIPSNAPLVGTQKPTGTASTNAEASGDAVTNDFHRLQATAQAALKAQSGQKGSQTPELADENLDASNDPLAPAYLPTSEMDDAVIIPPERRSNRTPKPAKKFGDVLTWAEADSHDVATEEKPDRLTEDSK